MDDTEQGTIRTKKIYKEFKYNISQSQDKNIEIDETDYQNTATGKGEDKEGAETEPDYKDDIEDEED
ncbi:24996_t:CDS:2 [Gigaspora margarita]|uniref:24996_t:CDS:1 n=1 Tax=Gigaspora margarita TaxID=4874 RepID=A0ABN7XJ93_GIGMA|nr:24996_t:CDS:2 [Gigaspora margarita]